MRADGWASRPYQKIIPPGRARWLSGPQPYSPATPVFSGGSFRGFYMCGTEAFIAAESVVIASVVAEATSRPTRSILASVARR